MVQRFRKILVAIDGYERKQHALDRAVALAEHSGARLKLIDVINELPVFLRVPSYGYPALSDTLADEKRKRLEKLAKKISTRGLSVDFEVLYGKPFLEIIREVLRNGHELVMKTAEQDGFTRLFGTTDMRLLRKCPCAVWIVKPTRARRYRRILAAVDPAEQPAHAERLNLRILELASWLSQLEEGELHILHAWNPPTASLAPRQSSLPPQILGKLDRDARTKAKASLEDLLKQLPAGIRKSRVHLLRGEPGLVIRDFANKPSTDILVMGTVVRTGIEGFVIGNTAEQILGQVQCSVLAVKPEGFISPVKLAEDNFGRDTDAA